MNLELIVLITGIVFAGVPLTAAVLIASWMFWGAAGDDEVIKALLMLGITLFVLGIALIIIALTTDFIPSF